MSSGHSEGVPLGVIVLAAMAVILGIAFIVMLFNWHAHTGEPRHEGIPFPSLSSLEEKLTMNQINPILAERFAEALANKTGKQPRAIRTDLDAANLAAEIVKKVTT